MAGRSAVTLRLGVDGDEKIQAALRKIGQAGDQSFAGLSKEAKAAARSFDRLEKSVDAQARSAAQVARAYVSANQAIAAGVRTQQDAQRVVDLAAERHKRLTKELNDNAKATGLARHELINLSRQGQDVFVSLAGGQSPLMVFIQQGSQIADVFGSSKAGAGAAVRSFGINAVKALASPIGIALELAAAVGGVAFQASSAQVELAKLSEQSRLTGLPADVLQGAKTIGAGVGLDENAALGAFGNAGREFQSFGRNEGAVKSTLEKIDKGFLSVVDRARSAGEFIDILNDKIRNLPTAQAEQLAKALYSEEGGAKLVDAIQRGEVSMRALLAASGSTGNSLSQSASAAEEMRNKIAQAAQEADNKLLNAFKNIKSPTDDIKLGWYGIVGSISDAITKSEKLQRVLSAMTSFSALFKEIGAAYNAADKFLGARPVVSLEDERRARLAGPGDIPFPNFNDAKQGFLPKLINAPVGESRNLFLSDPKKTGKSASEKSAEKFTDIEASLKNQIALASSLGAEHDKIVLATKIEAEQLKLGSAATAAQKEHVADLVTRLSAAQTEAANYKQTMNDASSIAKDSMKGLVADLREGNNLGKSLQNTLANIATKLINKTIDNGIDSIFSSLSGGGAGQKSGGFGFGPVGKTVGSVASSLGASSTVSTIASTLASAASAFFSGGSMFADGGVMTSAGPLPLRRYAGGGIADSPQLAMFGEGRMPEAFVPLPDGRSIPVAMRGQSPNVTVHNYAAGVEVTPRMTPQGVALIVQEIGGQMIRQNNRAIPGIVADQRKRSR